MQLENTRIQIQNQTLTVPIEIVGTPYSIQYHSDRVEGRNAAQLNIPLLGDEVPDKLKRVDLEILIAGQKHTYSFTPEANQDYQFSWDKKDAYGDRVQGRREATIRIGYVYRGEYKEPAAVQQSFAQFTEIAERTGVSAGGDRGRNEIIIWKEVRRFLGNRNNREDGLGGWNLNVHHRYDPIDGTVYLGDGRVRGRDDVGKLTTIAGGGSDSPPVDGAIATDITLGNVTAIEVDERGNVYIADTATQKVYHVDSDGFVTTVAGNGEPGIEGDEGAATDAQLTPTDIALDSSGNLYIADEKSGRIRVVKNGIISTVTGGGATPVSNGVAASRAVLGSHPVDYLRIAIGESDEIYISTNYYVYKIDSNGKIRIIGGGGTMTPSDGRLVRKSEIRPVGLSIGPDGALYIIHVDYEYERHEIYRVESDGRLTQIVGGGPNNPEPGIPARDLTFHGIKSVTAVETGDVYFTDYWKSKIYRVSEDRTLFEEAGDGISPRNTDGVSPRQARISPEKLISHPDGSLYFVDYLGDEGSSVRKISSAFEPEGTVMIASEEGDQLYVFDENGRHLKTVDTLTGASIYEFTYTEEGYLNSIEEYVEEDEKNTTMIKRSGGSLSEIIAPYGQRTGLDENENGYLKNIINPAEEGFQLEYFAEGLLHLVRDPEGNETTFDYDESGRLSLQKEPDNGQYILRRIQKASGFQVDLDTAELRHSRFLVEQLPSGEERQVNSCCGRSTLFSKSADSTIHDIKYPNGSSNYLERGPDPRFRMQAPLTNKQEYRSPAGLNPVTTTERSVELENKDDPLSLQRIINRTRINGREYSTVFDADNQTRTLKTPEGRTQEQILTKNGRLSSSRTAGLTPTQITYDRGRISEISQTRNEDGSDGIMRTRFNYYRENSLSNGYLKTITDSEERETHFQYDNAGRIEELTLPGDRKVKYDHDKNGNVTSITPPGQPTHRFEYTTGNRLEEYHAPAPIEGEVSNPTIYKYNRDGQLRHIHQPDGETISVNYHTTGEIESIEIPNREIVHHHDPSTGNLSSVTTSDGEELSFGYDGGLIDSVTWSGTVNGSFERTYRNDLRVDSQRINGENEISYEYDDDGLLKRAGELRLNYDLDNGLLRDTVLQGVTDEMEYYESGEIKTYTAKYGGSIRYRIQYEYDNIGRISKKTETVDDQTDIYEYRYDQAGRLHIVEKNGSQVSRYEYDANGNRKRHITPEGSIQATYDRQDRLQEYGDATYEYASTGELQRKTIDGETTTYEYDALGNLVEVVLPNGTEIEYVIDGQNRRIATKVNGVVKQRFLYKDGLNPVAELDGSNAIISQFIYSEHSNVPSYVVKGDSYHRVIADRLGSPILMINSSTGDVSQRIEYDEFGNIISNSNPGFHPFGFKGGLYSHLSGLTRFGTRDYDAKIGRWTTKDPIGFTADSSNLYEYTHNDPINMLDTTGMQAHCPPYAHSHSPTGNDLGDIYYWWYISNPIAKFQTFQVWGVVYILAMGTTLGIEVLLIPFRWAGTLERTTAKEIGSLTKQIHEGLMKGLEDMMK